jgi:hypothetical protein
MIVPTLGDRERILHETEAKVVEIPSIGVMSVSDIQTPRQSVGSPASHRLIRAIIKGTDKPDAGKAVYAKYVGH